MRLALLAICLFICFATQARAQDPVAGAAAGIQQEALPPADVAGAPMVVFTAIFNALDGPLQGGAAGMITAVAAQAHIWVVAGLTLWLALWCISVMYPAGSGQGMFFSGLFREFLVGAVVVTTIDIYANYAMPLLLNMEGELANLFVVQAGPQIGAGVAGSFDMVWENTRNLANVIEQRIPDSLRPSILIYWILIPILKGIGFLALMWAFVIFLCVHVIAIVLVIAGPLFVGLAAFPATRRWMFGWLSALLGAVAGIGFLSLIIGLMFAVINQESKILGTMSENTILADQVDGFAAVIGVLLLLGWTMGHMPRLAASIFGAASVTGALATVESTVTGVASKAGRAIGKFA